jgi:glyoxylase-like metal-dependent hydrolase (beta-lactamase superfamily II)
MTPVRTFRIGELTCHALNAGSQRLDGGAMFGVVPKPLWERRAAPDDRNRIPLALRCLLVEHEAGLVLVDTGVGNKESDKFIDVYAVDNRGDDGSTRLDDAIASIGFTSRDIKYIINTHLHFDHAGGNTLIRGEPAETAGAPEAADAGGGAGGAAPAGVAELAFPEATYVVQRGELEFARHRNERTAASYLPPNFEPVAAAGRWQLVEGGVEVLPGIRVLPTPGHVPYHQSVVLESAGETACFIGDLIPTVAHLPLPWIMGYDLHPLVTLETKRRFLARAEAEGWVLIFEHEPGPGIGRIELGKKGYEFLPLDTPAGRG